MNAKCLILGGDGFIGRALCAQLLALGSRVRIFDRPDPERANRQPAQQQLEYFGGDFFNRDDVAEALQGCDVVYHLLSTTLPKNSNDNPAYEVETNVVATLQLLEQIKNSQVTKLVFASSGGTIYGIPQHTPISEQHNTDPLCAYGIGKLTIEKFLALYRLLHGLDYRVLRMANVYGEGQSPFRAQGAIAVFTYKALRNETIEIWGDGSVVRDYIHLDDVVRALTAVTTYIGAQRIFNIGAGRGYSLNDVLATLQSVLGRQIETRYTPGRKFDVPVNVLDTQLARAELQWQPQVSLQTGMARVAHWIATAYPSTAV